MSVVCSLALALLLAADAEPPFARLSTIEPAAGFKIEDVLSYDVDQDGNADLVVASSNAEPTPTRRLCIHLRRGAPPAFSSTPDATLDVTPDVVAYAIGDVHADRGCEILLFNASAVFAWRPHAADAERFVRLCACDFLWQFPDPKELFHWQAGVLDLDGDGQVDLVLPAPGGARIALQRRDGDGRARFEALFDLTLPVAAAEGALLDLAGPEVRTNKPRRGMSISIQGEGVGIRASEQIEPALVRIDERLPAPQCVDWDADGDLDLLWLSARKLFVFRQEPKGNFDPARRLELDNPVVVDRARELDVSYSARTLDIDNDRRADCIMFAGDKRASDVRTQVLVFQRRDARSPSKAAGKSANDQAAAAGERDALFGPAGAPSQLIVLSGFATPLRFQDVDGDGLPDLIVAAVKPDLIDSLRSASTERIDAELYVYRALGNGFSKRPDLLHKFSIAAAEFEYALDFVGDLTGDGSSELFERTQADRMAIFMTRRAREGGLTIVDKPLYELAIGAQARVVFPGRLQAGSWDLFVVEEPRVTCVSFR